MGLGPVGGPVSHASSGLVTSVRACLSGSGTDSTFEPLCVRLCSTSVPELDQRRWAESQEDHLLDVSVILGLSFVFHVQWAVI